MNIIPVIDLLDGQIVHARRGERQHYQPIQSSLCQGSDPLTIVQALLELYPFEQLYIADLNAIQKRGHHAATIAAIRQAFPQLKLWLDGGFSCADDLQPYQVLDKAINSLQWVIGSESLNEMSSYLALKEICAENGILSLDHSADGYQGLLELLQTPALWPQNVIIMTLAKVGSNTGADHEKLMEIIARAGDRNIYAAGGIRHQADLLELANLGVYGALVASALHNRQLPAQAIEKASACGLTACRT
ncbi:MAG: HisA/HisF-related TIM barrel protein [Methylophilaceae bacterium]